MNLSLKNSTFSPDIIKAYSDRISLGDNFSNTIDKDFWRSVVHFLNSAHKKETQRVYREEYPLSSLLLARVHQIIQDDNSLDLQEIYQWGLGLDFYFDHIPGNDNFFSICSKYKEKSLNCFDWLLAQHEETKTPVALDSVITLIRDDSALLLDKLRKSAAVITETHNYNSKEYYFAVIALCLSSEVYGHTHTHKYFATSLENGAHDIKINFEPQNFKNSLIYICCKEQLSDFLETYMNYHSLDILKLAQQAFKAEQIGVLDSEGGELGFADDKNLLKTLEERIAILEEKKLLTDCTQKENQISPTAIKLSNIPNNTPNILKYKI